MAETIGTGRTAAGSSSRTLAQAKDIGSELIDAVRDGATSLFEEQRDRAANEIASFGEVLRRSVSSLDQAGGATVARYTEDAARQINQFADTLRHRSFAELSGDIEDFARRWPMVFMAAAIGAGMVAGRFLVSSAARPGEPAQPQSSPSWVAGSEQPIGGARHDYGAVGGGVSGGPRAGYGAGPGREVG